MVWFDRETKISEAKRAQFEWKNTQKTELEKMHQSMLEINAKVLQLNIAEKVKVELKVNRTRMQAVGLVLGLPDWTKHHGQDKRYDLIQVSPPDKKEQGSDSTSSAIAAGALAAQSSGSAPATPAAGAIDAAAAAKSVAAPSSALALAAPVAGTSPAEGGVSPATAAASIIEELRNEFPAGDAGVLPPPMDKIDGTEFEDEGKVADPKKEPETEKKEEPETEKKEEPETEKTEDLNEGKPTVAATEIANDTQDAVAEPQTPGKETAVGLPKPGLVPVWNDTATATTIFLPP